MIKQRKSGKVYKRVLSILLAVVLCFGSMPVSATEMGSNSSTEEDISVLKEGANTQEKSYTYYGLTITTTDGTVAIDEHYGSINLSGDGDYTISGTFDVGLDGDLDYRSSEVVLVSGKTVGLL